MENKPEKKRFHFNVIDVLVILVIAALAAVLILKRSAVKQQAAAESSVAAEAISGVCEKPNLRYTVISEPLEPEFADAVIDTLNEANRIHNAGKLQDAYITGHSVDAPDEDGLVRVRFTVEAVEPFGDYYTIVDGNQSPHLGGQDIRVGRGYTLKTMRLELSTTILALEVLE